MMGLACMCSLNWPVLDVQKTWGNKFHLQHFISYTFQAFILISTIGPTIVCSAEWHIDVEDVNTFVSGHAHA